MGKSNSKKTTIGFSLFLEHILPYEKIEEKGRMRQAPIVHLGGGALNIIKTLLELGADKKNLTLASLVGPSDAPAMSAINKLLDKESFSKVLFSAKERPSTSYYLLPRIGKTWAFGDVGGKTKKISKSQRLLLCRIAKENDIKILCETSSNDAEMEIARIFLKKHNNNQRSILIPSLELIQSRRCQELLPTVDLIVFNQEEARAFWGFSPTEKDILNISTPYALITRGSKESWLKASNLIYHCKPKTAKNAPFIGGAGDATLAALIFNLFIKNKPIEESLSKAINIGTETLFCPTSYWQKPKR